jgi:hypothetical protein
VWAGTGRYARAGRKGLGFTGGVLGFCPPLDLRAAMTVGAAVAPMRPGRGLRGTLAAGTTHARLRLLLLALLSVTVLWGGVAAWSVAGHAAAGRNVRAVSEPLSLDAQRIYRALARLAGSRSDRIANDIRPRTLT